VSGGESYKAVKYQRSA